MKVYRIPSNRICVACDSNKTYEYNGYQLWKFHDGNYFCKSCYEKYIRDVTEKNKKSHIKTSHKRISYKGKLFYLKDNPRSGICSWCGRSDMRTHLHHIQYHDDNPLKDTIELCAKCHRIETIRLAEIRLQ